MFMWVGLDRTSCDILIMSNKLTDNNRDQYRALDVSKMLIFVREAKHFVREAKHTKNSFLNLCVILEHTDLLCNQINDYLTYLINQKQPSNYKFNI